MRQVHGAGFCDRHEPWPYRGWGCSAATCSPRSAGTLDSWIVVPELSWDLRSVFVPSVCYHSGNWEFLELGVMLLFHVGCFWLPVLEKSLNVAYILRELVVLHRPSPRHGPS